ncbi:unnamed protein product [Linum tenue]|uniref:Uncharacterized protein n=1 Tax=Linum tenue TaxID=586396 RepID=A0AAV0RTM7_9ROSI|nr:unnamed protein product [Linum tenue]
MLNTFNKKGAVKEAPEAVQKEVVEGGLLSDFIAEFVNKFYYINVQFRWL